jgi:hypothetical protein
VLVVTEPLPGNVANITAKFPFPQWDWAVLVPCTYRQNVLDAVQRKASQRRVKEAMAGMKPWFCMYKNMVILVLNS